EAERDHPAQEEGKSPHKKKPYPRKIQGVTVENVSRFCPTKIGVIGPAMHDRSGQGQAGNGFAAAQCVLDWDATYAIGPQGQRSVVWMERPDRHGHPTVRIAFSQPVCGACASGSAITTQLSKRRGCDNRRQAASTWMRVELAWRGPW